MALHPTVMVILKFPFDLQYGPFIAVSVTSELPMNNLPPLLLVKRLKYRMHLFLTPKMWKASRSKILHSNSYGAQKPYSTLSHDFLWDVEPKAHTALPSLCPTVPL